jgi:CHAT domain-containing protein
VRTDEQLGELPLGALRSPDAVFLSERAALITLAPGEQPQLPRERNLADAGRLLIVEPSIDQSAFTQFDPLPWAEREARAIAQLDPRAQLMQGSAATLDAFQRAAQQTTVFHFAGHAVVEPESQGRSFLAFSPAAGVADGRLPVSAISALDLSRMQLAVLSACGRNSSVHPAEQPVNELVLAFLEAGVASVVAGLWEVEDAGMSVVMEWLHRELRAGATPSEALRRVQVRGVRGTPEERRAVFALMVYGGAVERR